MDVLPRKVSALSTREAAGHLNNVARYGEVGPIREKGAPIFIASPSSVKPAQEGFHLYDEEEGREVGRQTLVCASWYKFSTVSMASVGKPRSYMIQSNLS
eukprot:1134733-Pelagomonas_calceolata.AAC.1